MQLNIDPIVAGVEIQLLAQTLIERLAAWGEKIAVGVDGGEGCASFDVVDVRAQKIGLDEALVHVFHVEGDPKVIHRAWRELVQRPRWTGQLDITGSARLERDRPMSRVDARQACSGRLNNTAGVH